MIKQLFSKHKSSDNRLDIASPLTGEAVPLEQVPDQAFAEKYMGDGMAIEPAEGRLVAPFDSKVAHLIHSHHAVILEHASGLQLLVHIGINTVALQGDGFKAHVQTGDEVKAGQLLIEFDIAKIKAAGYPVITPIVIANGDETVESLEAKLSGTVRAGEQGALQVVLKK
ncbi:PTS system, glucose-specific IIA component [Paenibacillus sp. UNCCL117]|uniref:PTS sugar transporter subunit IIA n=1 Tax=unclassified Paenibacillus TaxID=185978 RepID=UPI00087E9593|nr:MULTISPECIES: PTS glucose transporter subunit IIA [unclassified Paenibacillus]SDC04878.1 PTS system IIA component, Glc family [Paenibacillus sp. cl123]SFW37439.1 PTS system, glucose-specific IIA component [Paenibacillus sp. UNCCL117]